MLTQKDRMQNTAKLHATSKLLMHTLLLKDTTNINNCLVLLITDTHQDSF